MEKSYDSTQKTRVIGVLVNRCLSVDQSEMTLNDQCLQTYMCLFQNKLIVKEKYVAILVAISYSNIAIKNNFENTFKEKKKT